jgi:hypothetical protein
VLIEPRLIFEGSNFLCSFLQLHTSVKTEKKKNVRGEPTARHTKN